ncbi:MAG: putative polymerase sigma factor [Paucimonas sp.]|nr:putative polymerase sigma factor [Paucimonas sp.]
MRPVATTKNSAQDLSDPDLVQQVLAGDRNAFQLLMRRHNRPLYRTARSILKDDAEAEDALQDAYLLAYRNLEKFRGDASLATWLTRIVVNESIARLRKTSRTATVIQLNGDATTDYEPAEEAMGQADSEPEQSAQRAQVRSLIEKKIDALPADFRTVFMLRALEEMSVEETAACLGIPEATVRSRYFRARGLLREALSREIDFALEEAFMFDGARCDRIVESVLGALP